MIVAVASGGPTDLLARVMAPKLTEALGQQVIVDNRAGGNGNIGMEIAARALPDGHTWLLATAGQLTVNPNLYRNLPFDTIRDFAPISVCASLPSILITHPAIPARSVSELIRLGKAKPDYLIYATAGSGSPSHLTAELLKQATGINFIYVHYKGGAPAMIDVMSGQAHFSILGLPTVLPHVRTGKLRSLGVTTRERLSFAPDLPTLHESGLPGFEVTNWLAMLVPARTPKEVTARISAEVVAVLRRPDVRDVLSQQGFTPIASSPGELATRMRSDLAKWSKVVKDSKITAD
ncbi:MAG: tripartite tricarboxylate transporter substrate binding protein [Betaproteobacteria bacterium]|nr:tripartite tricarboxylate transporter substrate binding protein [Betaproteobacteria bacterium]